MLWFREEDPAKPIYTVDLRGDNILGLDCKKSHSNHVSLQTEAFLMPGTGQTTPLCKDVASSKPTRAPEFWWLRV